MQNVVVPLSGTFRPKGGMTNSVLNKASLLAESGHEVTLVTFRFRFDQRRHEKQLVEENLISPRVRIVNFYESLDLLRDASSSKRNQSSEKLPVPYLMQKQNANLTRFFDKQGDLLYTELCSGGEEPYILRRYYDFQLQLLRIDELDSDLILKRVRRYMPGIKTTLSESFISRSGSAYLTIWYRPDGSVRTVIDLSEDHDKINSEYGQLDRLQSVWFEAFVKEILHPVLLIDDPHSFNITQPALASTNRSILTLHSNTFNIPNDVSSGINKENYALLSKVSEFDKIVTSTNAQREDLSQQFPDSKFYAIPQSVDVPDRERLIDVKRDYNLLVYVGRLERSKQILELINHISPLFKKHPKLRFEIYGEGSLMPSLLNKIETLGLQESVVLMGRTENSIGVFAGANLSVMPTKFEGFGLTIAESMLAGTPVVAFDCRYGPADMIDDNESGRLVAPQNFEEFVAVLDKLLTNQSDIEAMRLKAVQKIEVLCSPSRGSNLWGSIVEN